MFSPCVSELPGKHSSPSLTNPNLSPLLQPVFLPPPVLIPPSFHFLTALTTLSPLPRAIPWGERCYLFPTAVSSHSLVLLTHVKDESTPSRKSSSGCKNYLFLALSWKMTNFTGCFSCRPNSLCTSGASSSWVISMYINVSFASCFLLNPSAQLPMFHKKSVQTVCRQRRWNETMKINQILH